MAEMIRGIWGIERCNFDPSQMLSGNFLSELEHIRNFNSISRIFAPRCNFTNRIVKLGEEDSFITRWYARTKNHADGFIVATPWDAVAFFSADGPIVAVHDESRNRFAVLNADFRCLVPEKQGRSRPKGIIKTLFEDHQFHPENVQVFFGYGIGPCCFGAKHLDEELDDYALNLPIGKATRGRRAGQRSIDLHKLIERQLMEMRVSKANITADMRCTSCEGMDNKPKYYSNTRIFPPGRNLVLVWRDDK